MRVVVFLNNFRNSYLLQCVDVRNHTSLNIYSYVKLTCLVTLVQCKYPITHKRCVHDPVARPVHGIGSFQYALTICASSHTTHLQGHYHRMLVAQELSQSEVKEGKVQGKGHQNSGKLAYDHHVKKCMWKIGQCHNHVVQGIAAIFPLQQFVCKSCL